MKLKIRIERKPDPPQIPCPLCGRGIYEHEQRIICGWCAYGARRSASRAASKLRLWGLTGDISQAEAALAALTREITSCKMTPR